MKQRGIGCIWDDQSRTERLGELHLPQHLPLIHLRVWDVAPTSPGTAHYFVHSRHRNKTMAGGLENLSCHKLKALTHRDKHLRHFVQQPNNL